MKEAAEDARNTAKLKRDGVKQPKYSNDPYIEAKKGGVHSGQYDNFLKQDKKQLEKSINSFEKQVRKHEEKLRNPKAYDPNWDKYSLDRKNYLTDHWKRDISRQKEHKHIAEQVLKSKLKDEL